MDVRLAKKEEIDTLMEMFDHSRTLMRRAGNLVQWTNGYPQRELILESIRRGQQYVFIQNSEPVGTFWFIVGQDP